MTTTTAATGSRCPDAPADPGPPVPAGSTSTPTSRRRRAGDPRASSPTASTYRPSVDETRHDFEHQANFDLARDVLVAEIDGRLVASAERNIVVRDGVAVHQSDCRVHPDDPATRHRTGADPLAGAASSRGGRANGRDRAARARHVGRRQERPPVDRAPRVRGLPAGPLRLHDGPPALGADPGRAAARRSRGSAGRRGRPPEDLGRRLRGVRGPLGEPPSGPRRTSSAGSRCRTSTRACAGSRGTATRSRARSWT